MKTVSMEDRRPRLSGQARRPSGQARRLSSIGAVLAIAVWILFGPLPPIQPSQSRTILDRNGIVLYEPLTSHGNRAEWLTDVPPNVARATIAAEDRRFRWHLGIDPIAIARAAWHDAKQLGFVEGGSTITQQVAKMLLDSRDRGLIAKMREAIVAIRLERRYSKREILALYINLAPYGNQIQGIARASHHYFSCAPEDLTPAQAAFLASLPRRPGDVKRALRRQQRVAPGERLRFAQNEREVLAQHFIEHVLEQSHAARIETTLDARLQREVQGIIAAHRGDLLRHGAHSAAVVVLDNATGEWLAWEGSGDYFGSNFGGAIDGVTALRQPGSAMKPFTYAVAFERGDSPASVIADVPQSFPTAEEGIVYTPRNYDGRYRGPLRARSALAGSENVPAVALLSRIGAPSLLRFLRQAGFRDLTKTADYYGLGLTLGDAEVRLDQLVAAYSIFPRGGTWIQPRMVLNHVAPPPPAARLLSPRTSFWITDILSDSHAREFIFGSGGNLDFPFPVAVKTGTSQAYRDNWTVGYTRDVTVGVWVGNFDRTELRNSSGVTGAGPIFHDVMLAAAKHASDSILDPPPNVERAPVCALSGLRPSIYCPAVETEWIATEAPVEFCSWHHRDSIAWPDEYRAWAKPLHVKEAPARAASLKVVNPPNGATYLIDPTLRAAYQTLSLRAIAHSAVTWRVDERRVGSQWPLAPGKHIVSATDGDGHRDDVKIYVK
jgi:penicillin-binding protein 1C